MNNTENKNKVVLKKMIKKQFFITVITSFFLLFIVIGSSYSVFSSKTETGLTDVVVQSGNLLASISSTSETIEMNYETLGVSDEVGLSYEPYTFTVKNNGQNLIKYYELRIVDKEYGNSTLPHKAINYSLSKNSEDYTEPQNLGDNRSYIYVGGSLEPGESDTFNLKLWVNEEFGKYANNKEINASIEITLYSDIPTRNYINYDTQGGSYIPKTSTASKRVTNQIPLKGGYSFVGWSTVPNGDVEYESNAIYDGNNGITLYAKYEEATITYNLNGGTGEIPSNKVTEGITSVVPTKEGYIFMGWSSNPNATEVEYQSGDTYTGGMILLYAVWYIPPKAAEEIIEKVVAYSVSSPPTFTGGLVGVNTDGLLYNEADENQQVREYRYSGRNVNNYIYFNCSDTAGGYAYGDANYPYNETNCELWRIVGIFKNSVGEWNLKLMRNTLLQASELVSTYTYNGTTYNIQSGTGNTVYWNYKSSGTNNNDWTTAGLQYFLNTNKDSNDVAGYYSTIKDTSKVLIDENYTYYLGNVILGSSGDNTQTAYNNERDANNKHSGNQSSWPGAIALLYPSDYGYSARSSYWNSVNLSDYEGTPKNSNWMMNDANHSDEWLLSPSSGRSDYAIGWYPSGYLSYNGANRYRGARPVLNLKSETTRLKGDGTSGTPYVIIGE